MYKAGNIIYFDPFYFKNGNPAKPKYFIVLKEIENNAIIVSLPTRKDSIPQMNMVEKGCVELPEINFNCYVFCPNEIATTCGKSFPLPTFIYGYHLDTYQVDELKELYKIENVDYTIFGELKPDLFKELIDCLIKSKTVKTKYIKLLSNK